RRYNACDFVISTSTTIVFAILVETTSPTLVARPAAFFSVISAMAYFFPAFFTVVFAGFGPLAGAGFGPFGAAAFSFASALGAVSAFAAPTSGTMPSWCWRSIVFRRATLRR